MAIAGIGENVYLCYILTNHCKKKPLISLISQQSPFAFVVQVQGRSNKLLSFTTAIHLLVFTRQFAPKRQQRQRNKALHARPQSFNIVSKILEPFHQPADATLAVCDARMALGKVQNALCLLSPRGNAQVINYSAH